MISDNNILKTHEKFMSEAINEALSAYEEGEVPIGAVAVKNGALIGKEHNRVEQLKDCTAHAEMLLLRKLFKKTGDWRLEGISLYVTLEPCAMCAGAVQLARIDSLIFGTDNKKKGAVNSLFKVLDDARLNHRVKIIKGVKETENRNLLKKFFKERRNENY